MQYQTAKQVAEKLGMTEGHFARLRVRGDGPRFIKIGRAVRYDLADVQAWLDARRVGSTSEELAA
jgi:predicted DNA-binding transcriptional regulator AlpA